MGRARKCWNCRTPFVKDTERHEMSMDFIEKGLDRAVVPPSARRPTIEVCTRCHNHLHYEIRKATSNRHARFGEGTISKDWLTEAEGKSEVWFIACDRPGCQNYGGIYRITGERAMDNDTALDKLLAQGWACEETQRGDKFVCPACQQRDATAGLVEALGGHDSN